MWVFQVRHPVRTLSIQLRKLAYPNLGTEIYVDRELSFIPLSKFIPGFMFYLDFHDVADFHEYTSDWSKEVKHNEFVLLGGAFWWDSSGELFMGNLQLALMFDFLTRSTALNLQSETVV